MSPSVNPNYHVIGVNPFLMRWALACVGLGQVHWKDCQMRIVGFMEGSAPHFDGRAPADRKPHTDFLTSEVWSRERSALFISAASLLSWAIMLFPIYWLIT